MFTLRCNASCRHCYVETFGSGMQDMPLEDALRYIDEMVVLSDKVNGFSIYLSGGEPFLRFQDLLRIVHHCREKGVNKVSCVTNGFWGNSSHIAKRWAAKLVDVGMTQIYFSLDYFHQEFIPLKSVITALNACQEKGLSIVIKSTITRSIQWLPQKLNDLDDILINNNIPIQKLAYVPHESVDCIPENDWLVQDEIPNELCPELNVLAILPNGITFPCCGSGWTQRLVVGNASIEPMIDLVEKLQNKNLYNLLREKGPRYLLSYYSRMGLLSQQKLYVNRCHVCKTVLNQQHCENKVDSIISNHASHS